MSERINYFLVRQTLENENGLDTYGQLEVSPFWCLCQTRKFFSPPTDLQISYFLWGGGEGTKGQETNVHKLTSKRILFNEQQSKVILGDLLFLFF